MIAAEQLALDYPEQRDDDCLLGLLKGGRRNVRSSYDLARHVGISQRSVGFSVNRLRRRGHPIGSVHGEGYYLIETEAELAATIDHIERRKRGIDQTIAALREGFASA